MEQTPIKGIDITDILKLRRMAEVLDWYRVRMQAQGHMVRAAITEAIAEDARAEADAIALSRGLDPREV